MNEIASETLIFCCLLNSLVVNTTFHSKKTRKNEEKFKKMESAIFSNGFQTILKRKSVALDINPTTPNIKACTTNHNIAQP